MEFARLDAGEVLRKESGDAWPRKEMARPGNAAFSNQRVSTVITF
jgi:hypothetical protein